MSKRIADYPILYSGSVKKVRDYDSETLLFEFTDQVSVFDWGALSNQIPGKGHALSEIGLSFFSALSDPAVWRGWVKRQGLAPSLFRDEPYRTLLADLESKGLSTHFRGALKEGDQQALLVEKVKVVRPVFFSLDGKQIPQYSRNREPGELIPLEVVFRHEIVSGSSVLKRDSSLKVGDRFETPLVEFYTKLEPQDRYLNDTEAFLVSGLTREKFIELKCKTVICSLFLKSVFEQIGVRLVDGKLEWALGKKGELMLVDSIGPDELRILKNEKDISKEILREFYRKTPWYADVVRAKALAPQEWKTLVKELPERMPPQVIDAISSNYRSLANEIKTAFEKPVLTEKVFLYGSGAREHAIALAVLKSNFVTELLWSTTNRVAFEQVANAFQNKTVKLLSVHDAVSDAKKHGATLAVIGPDQALADGLADRLIEAGISVFGPKKAAARLEWSKSFSKQIMKAAGVSTARFFELSSKVELIECVRALDWSSPWVLKADGLALGKGVVICRSLGEALNACESLSQFGNQFVVEEFLTGREISMFAVCDGETCRTLGSAQDYKTLLDRQQGPNTGGMGAVSPAPQVTVEFEEKILNEVFLPTVKEMKKRGTPYVGVLYAGLMVKGDQYWVLEFNSRFGDPEAQALLPRIHDDLVMLMKACATQKLDPMTHKISVSSKPKYYVVAAAPGYPESPKKGLVVSGLGEEICDSIRFAAVEKKDGQWLTSGGRVLGVLGESKREAYEKLKKIKFEGIQYRRDIGGVTSRLLILASGRGSNFEALLNSQRQGTLDAEFIALGCNRKEAKVFEIAQKYGVESFLIQDEEDLQKKIRACSPDYVILAGYDRILRADTIDLMRAFDGRSRIINIHPSLLPAFKGLHSYKKAFEAKVKITGVTVHRLEPALDSGPILAQESFSIELCESAREVESLGLTIEHRLYSKTLGRLFEEEG